MIPFRAQLVLLASAVLSLPPAHSLGATPIKCGTQWINIHKGNPDLVGIYVQQSPDNLADVSAYRGKHPAMVAYVFKDGRMHQLEYTPSGQVESGSWSQAPSWIYARLTKDLKSDISCHWSAH